MEIKAYKNELDYYITFDSCLYEMDSISNQPNGICIFMGEIGDGISRSILKGCQKVKLGRLPIGTRRQIVNILKLIFLVEF